MTRPLILGMNNPISSDPRHALYPYPPGCAGHRLYSMLEAEYAITRADYMRLFERQNLLVGEWSPRRARLAGQDLLPSLSGRRVAVLSRAVWVALGLPADAALLENVTCSEALFLHIPHPSGRNLWYNSPENRTRAAHALYSLLDEDR